MNFIFTLLVNIRNLRPVQKITGLFLLCLLNFFPVSAQHCNTDVTNNITAANITASGENPPSETREKAFDDIVLTKWLTNAATGSLRTDLGTAKIVTYYSITSANDEPTRDPRNFILEGSNNGSSFTTIDTRSGETFATRFLTKYYSVSNTVAYRYYRLSITANNGATGTQLAEVQFLLNSDCVVGNVFLNSAGTGYPSVPVNIRNASGTFSSVTTNAAGRFVFSVTQTPVNDYAVIVQPPVNTWFYSGPAVNINTNAAVMNTITATNMPKQIWPNGAFLNINGQALAPSGKNYLVDNSTGVKTPASLDWILKPTPANGPACAVVSTTLDGNGDFGKLSTAHFLTDHPWQPAFHPANPITEAHPDLFKPFGLATTAYTYNNAVNAAPVKGVLYDESRYNITSFIGTQPDGVVYYNTGFDNASYNLLNGFGGGWRKTYGHTTGDAYDQFLAVNGSPSLASPLLQFTASITTTGLYYFNFFGKNANAFVQNINTPVELILRIYNAGNVLISTTNLSLPPVTAATEDLPTSPWVGKAASFTAGSTGTYTFKLDVNTTSLHGNDFYLDDISLSACSVLPITLSSFTASKAHSGHAWFSKLVWKTSTEINSDHFVVERSSDGVNFSSIAMVAALNTNTINTYAFNDMQPLAGYNYYRLKMTDKDASYRYSTVAVLNFELGEQVSVGPNPAAGFTRVSGLKPGMKIGLYTADGGLAATYNTNGNVQVLPLAGFSSGVYFIRVFDADGQVIKNSSIIKL